MKERIVSLRTAKLAKEKGFKISCHSYYFEDGEFREHKIEITHGYYGGEVIYEQEEFYENWNSGFLTTKDGDRCFGCKKSQGYFETYSAPSQSLLQKWLREEKDILVYVDPKSHHFFESHIITSNNEIISNRGDNWENVLENSLYIALQEI